MHVINRYRLRDFWESHSPSELPLRAWYQLVTFCSWDDLESLQQSFPNATAVDRFTVFDIYGSTYFLVTQIDFERRRIAVRDVLVHNIYHKTDWQQALAGDPAGDGLETGSFIDLVRHFEPRPIGDVETLRRASSIVDRLAGRDERSRDVQDYLEVLSLLIDQYESAHVPIPPVSGAEIFRLLNMEHRLSHVELIPLLGSKAKVLEVIKGKRPLNLRQVSRVSRYFKLPPEAFVDPEALE